MARKRRIDPQDIVWEEARRAELHLAHAPQVMRSGCSTPPIYMWVCDVPSCQMVSHTVITRPPICYGGYSTKTQEAVYRGREG